MYPSHNLPGKTYTLSDFQAVLKKVRSIYPDTGHIGS
jgi:hypothetical protein